MKLTLNSKVKRCQEVAWRILEDNLVVITPKDTTIHRANETGVFIWQQLGSRAKRVEQIVKTLHTTYDVTEKKAQSDVLSFVKTAVKKRILEISP